MENEKPELFIGKDEARWNKPTVFEYNPKDKRFDNIFIATQYWGSDTPFTYRIIEDAVELYFARRVRPLKLELKHLPELESYLLEHHQFKMKDRTHCKPTHKFVGEVLKESNVGYYSVCYHHSRIIKDAHFREAIAYLITSMGAVVFFKKRGGISCYHIGTLYQGTNFKHSTATYLCLKNGLELLEDAKHNKTGKVFLPMKSREEIINTMILEKI
jgi:hypothetical protein